VTHTAQTATLAAMQDIIKELFEQNVDMLKVVVEEGILVLQHTKIRCNLQERTATHFILV